MAERAVYKATAAEFLDDMLGVDPDELAAEYERCLTLLAETGGTRLAEAAAQLVADGLPADAVAYSKKGWREPLAVDRVIRHGYAHAISVARESDPPLPMDTLWVTGASPHFEIHVCAGTRRVTVLLFIPGERPYGSTRAKARSWVVRAADGAPGGLTVLDGDDPPIVLEQVSGP